MYTARLLTVVMEIFVPGLGLMLKRSNTNGLVFSAWTYDLLTQLCDCDSKIDVYFNTIPILNMAEMFITTTVDLICYHTCKCLEYRWLSFYLEKRIVNQHISVCYSSGTVIWSRYTTFPTRIHVRPAKTQISLHRLIGVFTVHLKTFWVLRYP